MLAVRDEASNLAVLRSKSMISGTANGRWILRSKRLRDFYKEQREVMIQFMKFAGKFVKNWRFLFFVLF